MCQNSDIILFSYSLYILPHSLSLSLSVPGENPVLYGQMGNCLSSAVKIRITINRPLSHLSPFCPFSLSLCQCCVMQEFALSHRGLLVITTELEPYYINTLTICTGLMGCICEKPLTSHE